MKCAKVLPIFKNKGSKLSCNNYRPISILPLFSKIFEKLINAQILNHIESEKLICDAQFGFQRNKGTREALVEFVNNAFASLNESKVILGIFIDFSKAFDTINHDILHKKLRRLNFSRKALQLLQNYLLNRSQRVVIDGHPSDPLPISCGVPQGSILGPTLFLLYINDLVKSSSTFKTILFADDTNLFFSSKEINNKIDEINFGLDRVRVWCNTNKLTLNIDKTNYIIIKNPQNRFHLTKTITMNGSPISEAENVKFLGIIIDPKLNWSGHINKLRLDLHKSLGLIYLASTYLPTSTLILLYNCLVNSRIIYCIE
jgi:hypothetical protein